MYNYVDNLTVTKEGVDENGSLMYAPESVKVRVSLSNLKKGDNNQVGETMFKLDSEQSAFYYGSKIYTPWAFHNPSTNIAGKDLLSAFDKQEFVVGFNIVLYKNGMDTETLANEAGDVMFALEYNDISKQESKKSDQGYWNKISTRYSFAVEETHQRIRIGTMVQGNIYPLIFEKNKIFTQDGTEIR